MSPKSAAELSPSADIEEIPHPDDAKGGEFEEDEVQGGEEGEEEPFTEEEVSQLYVDAQEALGATVDGDDLQAQLNELDAELDGKDVQERGRILAEVLDYIANLQQGGGQYQEDEYPDEYQGEELLEELYQEVLGRCVAEDKPRLEKELEGKQAEEQWRTLLEVRDYLLGDGGDGGDGGEEEVGEEEWSPEEQAEFDAWTPTPEELDGEWDSLMASVPPKQAREVQLDYDGADDLKRKQMVWDVRKFIEDEQEAEEQEAMTTRPPTDAEIAAGRTAQMRRRGGAKGREYADEYNDDSDERKAAHNGASSGGGMRMVVGGVVCLLVLAGAVVYLRSSTAPAFDDMPSIEEAVPDSE